ncbi:MAG TPA: hypothetical protein VK015_00085 [Microbacterium sp.]|nr:hypothetical protein [Microbacterium sp.]
MSPRAATTPRGSSTRSRPTSPTRASAPSSRRAGSGDDCVTIALSPCHNGAAIDADIDTVCAVHERLIRTTLEQTPGPMRLESIEPFVEPGVCRLRLRIERPAARA